MSIVDNGLHVGELVSIDHREAIRIVLPLPMVGIGARAVLPSLVDADAGVSDIKERSLTSTVTASVEIVRVKRENVRMCEKKERTERRWATVTCTFFPFTVQLLAVIASTAA